MKLVLNVARPWGEDDPAAVARAALAAGADGVGFADSPRLFPDPWLQAAELLAQEPAALAGPCVLGLGLHHPSVVARALLTLDRQRPGRVFAVVGRGESSVRNEGLRPPSLDEYTAALDVLGEQIGGGPADGALMLGAASGPRTIAATAARLPGVLVDAGADPAVVGKAVAVARAQSPDVRCWLFLRAVVVDTPDEAVAAAAPVLGSCAARLAAAPDWYEIPLEQRRAVAAFAAGYDYRRHGTDAGAAGGPDAELAALIRRQFLLAGDAAEVTGRLRPLAELGIDGVVVAGATAGLTRHLGATLTALRAGLVPAADRPETDR